MRRQIDVITVGRSDFGIYTPVLDELAAAPNWDVGLIVSGGHLDDKAGISLNEIEASGHTIREKLPLEVPGDDSDPARISEKMGVATRSLARAYRHRQPDLAIVLGDRYEMFALCTAIVPFDIPIAHIHGGELSFGAIDEVFRHAITKMSHLHFTATQEYADRVVQMGEEPWRVTVSGAPGLDVVRTTKLPTRQEIEEKFSLDLSTPPILVTIHPVTRQNSSTEDQIGALLSALHTRSEPIVFSAPNLDSGADTIRNAIADFVKTRDNASMVENFGHAFYFAMLRDCAAVVGNSSSGLIETPLFEVPTLNIGDRQSGRTRASNVVDVPCTKHDIEKGLSAISESSFRKGLVGMVNPYGDGHAAARIVEKLNTVEFGSALTQKIFFDG